MKPCWEVLLVSWGIGSPSSYTWSVPNIWNREITNVLKNDRSIKTQQVHFSLRHYNAYRCAHSLNWTQMDRKTTSQWSMVACLEVVIPLSSEDFISICSPAGCLQLRRSRHRHLYQLFISLSIVYQPRRGQTGSVLKLNWYRWRGLKKSRAFTKKVFRSSCLYR